MPVYELQVTSYVSIANDIGNESPRDNRGFARQKPITDSTDANAGSMLYALFHVIAAETTLQSRKNTSQSLLFAHFLS